MGQRKTSSVILNFSVLITWRNILFNSKSVGSASAVLRESIIKKPGTGRQTFHEKGVAATVSFFSNCFKIEAALTGTEGFWRASKFASTSTATNDVAADISVTIAGETADVIAEISLGSAPIEELGSGKTQATGSGANGKRQRGM